MSTYIEGSWSDVTTKYIAYPCSANASAPDAELTSFIKMYPHADVFQQKRTPGTIIVRKNVVMMVCQLCNGLSNDPQDSKRNRMAWFEECLLKIADIVNLDSVAFPEMDADYVQAINDFFCTANLAVWKRGLSISTVIVKRKCMQKRKKTKRLMSLVGAGKKIELQLKKHPTAADVAARNSYLMKYFAKQKPSKPTRVSGTVTTKRTAVKITLPELFETMLDDDWKFLISADHNLLKSAQRVSDRVTKLYDTSTVYPPRELIWSAFDACTLDNINVVIWGQDPYHGRGQAHGLSFSVPLGVKVPPSLRRIYSALVADSAVKFTPPGHGCLTEWAKQGVLMLNAALTVPEGKPKGHQKIWAEFSNNLIKTISKKCNYVVFVLWGRPAQALKSLIDVDKHSILEYRHPSPLSRGDWSECRHFSKINRLLADAGKDPIDWSLTHASRSR